MDREADKISDSVSSAVAITEPALANIADELRRIMKYEQTLVAENRTDMVFLEIRLELYLRLIKQVESIGDSRTRAQYTLLRLGRMGTL